MLRFAYLPKARLGLLQMLHVERECRYYVYPSWAEVSYAWKDLPRLLSDPLNSSYIRGDPNNRRYDWKSLGYAIPVQSFDVIDGPVAGGIVRAHVGEGERWLPEVILHSEANLISPPSVRPPPAVFDAGVCYIEPWDEPGWQFGAGRKKKLYVCALSMEHVESDPGNVYWIVGLKKGKREVKGLEHVQRWGRHFSMDATRLTGVPQALREEVASWFVDLSYEYVWFRVRGGGEGLGYHFAVVVYLGLHLRKVAGPRMFYMHLTSEIEGRPNSRPFDFRR